MKLLSSYRYQVHDQRMAILVFYGVMVGMVLLNLLFLPFETRRTQTLPSLPAALPL